MNWDLDLGMQKMARYAAYQDRSRFELVTKLKQIGCPEDKREEILEELKSQGFWDEERFARSFTRGKFRQKGWGKIKIRQGLWRKGVVNEMVDLVLEEEIDADEYQNFIKNELTKRVKKLVLVQGTAVGQNESTTEGKKPDKGEVDFKTQQKVIQSLVQRGFEYQLVHEIWKDLF